MRDGKLRVGSRVGILSGNLRGFEATFEGYDVVVGNARVLIELFGYETTAQIPVEHLTDDIEEFRLMVRQETQTRYQTWIADECESLPSKPEDLNSADLATLEGSYTHDDGITSSKVILSRSGEVRILKWLDIGAHWNVVFSGFFMCDGTRIYSSYRNRDSCRSSFDSSGRLLLKEIDSLRCLVSEDEEIVFVEDED